MFAAPFAERPQGLGERNSELGQGILDARRNLLEVLPGDDPVRFHLAKLLEEGALPHDKTGKHRRVRFENLMQFKSERDRASEIAMEELTKQAQELEMGYK